MARIGRSPSGLVPQVVIEVRKGQSIETGTTCIDKGRSIGKDRLQNPVGVKRVNPAADGRTK